MFSHSRIIVILATMLYLGPYGSGFAQDSIAGKENTIDWLAPKTTEEIIDAYQTGTDIGATHMLLVWDTWNMNESYDFIIYSYPHEDVNDLIKYYTAPGYYRVSAVYAMHLDIHKQHNDARWYPTYP